MKCPMQTLIIQNAGTVQGIDFFQCIEKECAWWSSIKGKCGIILLGEASHTIGGILLEIREQMPHEAQFRK